VDNFKIKHTGEYGEYVRLAENGELPDGFDQWHIASKYGWTVAHVAAGCSQLPDTFDQWDLCNGGKWAVAHEAAKWGTLPEAFDRWGMTTDRTIELGSVLAIALRRSKDKLPYIDKILTRWNKEKPLCRTPEDWMVFKHVLPEIYSKYAIESSMSMAGLHESGMLIGVEML
jgi:hypothetical protein